MRKLKLDFHKMQKYIVTALAATMLTGCASGVNKENYDANSYNEPSIVEKTDKEVKIDENVDVVETIEEEIDEGISIDKLVINSVEDITEALQYDKISYLKINNANITDFSFLQDLDIELLQVINNKTPIDMKYVNSDSIEQLYFHNVQLENADEISNFKGLKNFVLLYNTNNNSITNLDFLKGCTKLTNIEVENYAIENLSFVKNMSDLRAISIKDSSIDSISGIENCKKLESLTITGAEISDISELSGLKELQTIDLSDNYITSIESINSPQLSYLDLKENFIKDASSLSKNDNLCYINISKNYIEEFPTVLLRDGSSIDISYNNIKELSNKDKEALANNNVSINMFDNRLSSETLKEISKYDSVYFETGTSVLTADQAIKYNNKINDIMKNMSDDEKQNIMMINKYIIDNCKLDYTLVDENKDNAYGALFEKAVCTGTTDLTNTLCRRLDIPVKQYHGDFESITDNERHVWSVCKVDGDWYHCDAMQSMANKDKNGYPKIVLLSDEEIKQYGHILDANNAKECNSRLEENERNNIISSIGKNMDQDLDDR